MPDMTKLTEEIKGSFTLTRYEKLAKFYKREIHYYRWIIGITFALSMVGAICGSAESVAYWINVVVWSPGLCFGLFMAYLHIATGIKLTHLTEDYLIERGQLQQLVSDTLNE